MKQLKDFILIEKTLKENNISFFYEIDYQNVDQYCNKTNEVIEYSTRDECLKKVKEMEIEHLKYPPYFNNIHIGIKILTDECVQKADILEDSDWEDPSF